MNSVDVSEMEKAAIVVMLCAPSTLNLAWARPDNPNAKGLTVDGVLNELPFSAEAKEHVRTIMNAADTSGCRPHFAAVAELLRNLSWPPRMEPHPTPTMATTIIATLQRASSD